MDSEKPKDPRGEPNPALLVLIFLVVVGVLVGNWWWQVDKGDRGTFGDMFGGVNALFSGLAFSVLVFTLLLQRFELKLQREELAETRQVLEAQREQMELQAKTQKLQQFENTFFQLIEAHRGMVSSFETSDGLSAHYGNKAIRIVAGSLRSYYVEQGSLGTEDARIQHAFERIYQSNEQHLGPLFRHLYHILKFIDESRIEDPLRYRAFLRAQVSTPELVLWFYDCLTPYGVNTKPLVERYGMWKNIPMQSLLKEDHRALYQESAFTPSSKRVHQP